MKPGVVVGYDRTAFGESALDAAAAEADRRGVSLTVVHAFRHEPVASPPYEGPAEVMTATTPQGIAQEGADRARSRHPGLAVDARAEAGPAASVLADLSAGADLLVVGHRGHGGFAGLELGSVALRAVARAACPTMVVRGVGHGTRGVVLAAVEIADSADEILGFAFAEAAQRGTHLKAISALEILWPWTPPGDAGRLGRTSSQVRERATAALERLVAPWQTKYPDVPTEYEVVEGAPSMVLTDATTYADLVVFGAHRRRHGHRGVRVGPIAHVLLSHADCPVVVVPHG